MEQNSNVCLSQYELQYELEKAERNKQKIREAKKLAERASEYGSGTLYFFVQVSLLISLLVALIQPVNLEMVSQYTGWAQFDAVWKVTMTFVWLLLCRKVWSDFKEVQEISQARGKLYYLVQNELKD